MPSHTMREIDQRENNFISDDIHIVLERGR